MTPLPQIVSNVVVWCVVAKSLRSTSTLGQISYDLSLKKKFFLIFFALETELFPWF